MRYAILQRRSSDSGVALRLRVDGGFVAEQRPGERGLAHLIEHIIFHSPTRTAPDELRRFRAVGFPLTLPDPAGGTTTWRESDYFVVSRTIQIADLDALLGLFREVCSELTFRADAVDSQRAEVLREMAERRLGNDLYAGFIAAAAPGSPTDLIDAQNSDDVPTASVETIRQLYERLYRPEHVTLVIVGDVDASEMATLIERRFGDWRGVGQATARGAVPSFDRARVAPVSYSDHRYGRNTALLTLVMPQPPTPPSRTGQVEAALMDMMVIRVVNNRLAPSRRDYPPGRYGMWIETGEQGHRALIFWDDFVPGQWRPAVTNLTGTICELRQAGFSEAEWAEAKRQLLNELTGQADRMGALPNFPIAVELANAITSGRHLLLPDRLFEHAQSWLPSVSAQQGSDWWRDQWQAGTPHLRVEAAELGRLGNARAVIQRTASEALRASGCRTLSD